MAAGQRVGGRYRLDEVLGAGGMGVVWRAYDERLHRPVAVKEIRYPSVVTAEERADLTHRAMLEARSAARLDHPGIVAVHDVVEEDDRPWIVMRLVEGRSLDQVVRADGPLSVSATADLGLALVDALSHAHAAGVVHRDVKPSNVLVQADGRILLTDFSIALVLGVGTVTKTGVLLGSPGYIAPERMLGGGTGPAADLFGLGATLYFAVEGRGPFDAAEPIAGLFATANQPHPRPLRSGALAPILDGLLAKSPSDRLTPSAARAALDSVAHPGAPAADSPDAPAPDLAALDLAATDVAPLAPTLRDVHILTTAVAPLPPAADPLSPTADLAAPTAATPSADDALTASGDLDAADPAARAQPDADPVGADSLASGDLAAATAAAGEADAEPVEAEADAEPVEAEADAEPAEAEADVEPAEAEADAEPAEAEADAEPAEAEAVAEVAEEAEAASGRGGAEAAATLGVEDVSEVDGREAAGHEASEGEVEEAAEAATVRSVRETAVDLGMTAPMAQPEAAKRTRTRRAAVVAAVAVIAVVVGATMLGDFFTKDTDGNSATGIEPSASVAVAVSPTPSPSTQSTSPSPTATASTSLTATASSSPKPRKTSPSPRRSTKSASPKPPAQAITAKLTIADSYLTANCNSAVNQVQTTMTVRFTAVSYPVEIDYRIVGGRYGPWNYNNVTVTSQTRTFSLSPQFDAKFDYTYQFYVEILSPTSGRSTTVPLQVEFCPH